jgi:hypothetical protein
VRERERRDGFTVTMTNTTEVETMKINGILECLNSRADIYGNRYFAFRYTDTATGKTVSATISGGQSNISSIPYYLHGQSYEPRDIHYTSEELPIREFNRLTKTWPHAGCTPEDLAQWIKTALISA